MANLILGSFISVLGLAVTLLGTYMVLSKPVAAKTLTINNVTGQTLVIGGMASEHGSKSHILIYPDTDMSIWIEIYTPR